MILAVTGGRNFDCVEFVFMWLDDLHQRHTITLLVHGACPTGLDAVAAAWAESKGVRHTGQKYAADWKTHGKAAGPIRNREMLIKEEPAFLLAFRGGRGTADCIRQAKQLGIPVDERPMNAIW